MRKPILYSVLIAIGLMTGPYANAGLIFKDNKKVKQERRDVTVNAPVEERPADYIKSVKGMIGKIITVNGVVQEVYKNKKNEVVVYLKDRKVPVLIKCNLPNPDFQIKYPLKIGETITIKGKFTEIEEEMCLENCKILYRSSKK